MAQQAALERLTNSLANVISKQLVAGDDPRSVGTNETFILALAKVFTRGMTNGCKNLLAQLTQPSQGCHWREIPKFPDFSLTCK